jgi:hypothetical protein
MPILGIEAHYQKPNLSRPAPDHRIYPYLLRGVDILRPNHVWSSDIAYIPMRVSLPGRGYGLVQPVPAELGTFQHFGDQLLRGRAQHRFRFGQPENLELRSRLAVHLLGVPSSASAAWHLDQHGWSWPGPRQCFLLNGCGALSSSN